MSLSGPISAGSLKTVYARRAKHIDKENVPVFGVQEFVAKLAPLAPNEPVVAVLVALTTPWVALFLSPELDKLYGCVVGEAKPYRGLLGAQG